MKGTTLITFLKKLEKVLNVGSTSLYSRGIRQIHQSDLGKIVNNYLVISPSRTLGFGHFREHFLRVQNSDQALFWDHLPYLNMELIPACEHFGRGRTLITLFRDFCLN